MVRSPSPKTLRIVSDIGQTPTGREGEGYDLGVATPLTVETCPVCGRRFARPVGRRKRQCPDCAADKVAKAAEQLKAGNGPIFDRWLAACVRVASPSAEDSGAG